jgi:ammonia channel protein AmtB
LVSEKILIENFNKILLLAFAAACTAGILYPLDWLIGIRLAKEDELKGLDLTGIIESFLYKIFLKNICSF